MNWAGCGGNGSEDNGCEMNDAPSWAGRLDGICPPSEKPSQIGDCVCSAPADKNESCSIGLGLGIGIGRTPLGSCRANHSAACDSGGSCWGRPC